jgi:hypothetical protein
MSCHHNGGQNDNIKIANESRKKHEANLKYFGMTIINQRFNSSKTKEYTDSGECNASKTKKLQKPSTFTKKII